MSALPRGWCAVCGAQVALRTNGTTREHRVYRLQSEQDPATHLGRMVVCTGSGKPPSKVRTTP